MMKTLPGLKNKSQLWRNVTGPHQTEQMTNRTTDNTQHWETWNSCFSTPGMFSSEAQEHKISVSTGGLSKAAEDTHCPIQHADTRKNKKNVIKDKSTGHPSAEHLHPEQHMESCTSISKMLREIWGMFKERWFGRGHGWLPYKQQQISHKSFCRKKGNGGRIW